MQRMFTCLATTALVLLNACLASAASLRAAPTNLEMIAPDSTGVLNLTNDGDHPAGDQDGAERELYGQGDQNEQGTGANRGDLSRHRR